MCYGEASGHDARCRLCGALLYSVVRDGAYVHVALGTLSALVAVLGASVKWG